MNAKKVALYVLGAVVVTSVVASIRLSKSPNANGPTDPLAMMKRLVFGPYRAIVVNLAVNGDDDHGPLAVEAWG